MLSIADYKKRFIDKQGKAPAILLNKWGEYHHLGEVHTVTNSNGRLKCRWRADNVPLQWHNYTHIALVGNESVVYLEEITPLNFDGKASNVEVTFYD